MTSYIGCNQKVTWPDQKLNDCEHLLYLALPGGETKVYNE
jgi:hypothetical protein